MRVVDIVRGMASGFGFKLLQILATLLVVPFLLREDVLGLEDYGRIFAILGLLSPLNLLTDGLRTSFSRNISRSLSREEFSTGEEIGNAFKLIGTISLVFALLLFPILDPLLSLISTPALPDYRWAIALAIVVVSIDNVAYILTSHLNARGRMDVANGLMGLEVIARNLVFLAWFSSHPGSVSDYFSIFLACMSIRTLASAAYALRSWPQDFAGFWSGSLASTKEAIRYSLSLSVESINFYVFQRLTIPLTASMIGAAEAGLLALGLNTITNNLSQILLNVVRPLLVPVAARIRFDRMSAYRQRLLVNLDSIYTLVAGGVTIPIIAGMPTLVSVWLGPERAELVLPAQILVSGAAFSVAFNVRRALMVGHGMAGAIARASLLWGGIGSVSLLWFLVFQPSWVGVSVVIALVGATSSIAGVGIAFDHSGLLSSELGSNRGLRATLTLLIACLIGYALSKTAPATLEPSALLAPIGAGLALLLTGHLLMIRMPTAYSTLRALMQGANREIFDEDGTGATS